MSRHEARETAFKMLFQMDVGNNDFAMAEHTLSESKLKGGYKAFALELVKGVMEYQFELNEYLDKFTKGWQVKRLAAVDRNLVKMAMYEMQYQQTPANIVINEAVELAKVFGTAESPAFVNAVLDSFYKKVMVENMPEYQIDETKKEAYLNEIAAAAKRAEMAAVEEFLKDEQEQSISENTKVVEENYSKENNLIKKQGFRKIKKADISEKEQIKEESILEDKKRIYGDNAFLTEKDLRQASEAGENISEADIKKYYQSKEGLYKSKK